MKTYPHNSPCRTALLHLELQAAGVPVVTVRGFGGSLGGLADSAEVVAEDSAVDATVAAVLAAHAPAAAQTETMRAQAKALFDRLEADGKLNRAVASVLLDQLNALREWTRNLKAAVASATTLANLKTAVAMLATLSDRDMGQARTTVHNRLDDGSVDGPPA